ncbi:baseplate J/gp47 family protein [Lachnospiraceae bacterium NSJ-143]|nr:baseplate J/gp47 family protein [Lachnospiraceae bacterium NSJ-143]
MYENLTYEQLLKEKLKLIDSSFDKRQGSVIYDTLAPNSAESIQMYMSMDMLMDRTFADTATGEDLDKRAWERNISRKAATNSVVKAVFTDESGEAFDVETGARFSGGGNDYCIIERIEKGCFKLACETAGEGGNGYTGKIIPVGYVDGLYSAEITEIIIYGENRESDDSLRKRYFESFQTKAFGGNIEDYKRIFSGIRGVGACKVYPAYYGGGTVRVVILNNDYGVPDTQLINDVQAYVDPQPKGAGAGAVPIGHNVTVEAAAEHRINIMFSLTFSDGYENEFLLSEAKNNIEEYFSELRKSWSAEEGITVRSSHIEMRILDVLGVIDVENIKLNGTAGNVVLDSGSIPVLGTVESV